MTNIDIPKASHEGDLHLGDTILKCAVLEDGTRLLTQRDVFTAFGRPRKGNQRVETDGTKLPSFLDSKTLTPYLPDDFHEWVSPVEYINKKGRKVQGYRADIIPLVCEVYLKANDDGALKPSQEFLATISNALVRSLAKVGITALVDEATGYQETRDKNELRKILEVYMAKELLPWTQRFPHEFYQEMFRLNGWQWTEISKQKKPMLIGKFTKELIYDQLPPGVYEELRRNTPKDSRGRAKHQLHRRLSEDIGNRHLEMQIASTMTLMRIAPNWRKFKELFARAFPGDEPQLTIDIDFDEE